MINVYDKNETDFEHNGLVVLNACKNCYTIQELNGAYSIELEYPKDERGKYKYLEGWNIIKADGQLFRIPQINKIQDTGLSIKINANHIFYDLLNDFNEDTRAENKTVEEALQIAITNPKFNILTSDLMNTNTAYFIRENPITSIFKKILPRWQGELYRDNFNIAIKQRVGQDTGILIAYGKNITGFEQTLDYSTVATRIMPVGKDGLTIDLVNQGSKYLESPRINDYPFVITKELKFEDIEDATELKNKVLSLWGTIDLPSVNYRVNFVELSKTKEYERFSNLESVNIGDTVTIRHKEFNVDISARVIKIKKNVLTNKIEEIELGQFKENLTDVFYKLKNEINYTNEVISDVNEDLQGTKTIVFQNQEQISLKAQELQTNIDNTKAELQGNIDNTNNNVSAIDTRVSEAELKITPSAITSTVRSSTEYNTDIQDTKNYADDVSNTAETNAKGYTDTLDSATNTRVDTVETTANNLNNVVVPAIESRVSEAELKITDSAIVSTVTSSETYNTDMTNVNSAITNAQNTADSKALPSYVDSKSSEAENNAKSYAENQANTAEQNANDYTDIKKTEIDNTVNILDSRVSSAEQKITDEAIINTVTKSEKYLEYNLVPNKTAIQLTRNSAVINPLNCYNYTGGNIINENELIVISSIQDLVYSADLQIVGTEVITFNKPSERIESAEGQIAVHSNKISLVVKENGTVDGDSLISAINMSSTKIEMSALNIDLTGYVTFNSLSEQGQTSIHGGNIMTDTISFNSLLDKPFIPSQYTDSEALQAWVNSNYATYIDNTGAYFGNITANQLLIGGENGSISFNDLSDKPTIPSQYTDALALQAWVNSGYKTYINSSGVYTGNLTALQVTTPLETADIVKVYRYIQFTKNPADLNGIQIDSSTGVLKILADQGVDIIQTFSTQKKLKVNGKAVATEEWVNDNVIGGAVYAKFK